MNEHSNDIMIFRQYIYNRYKQQIKYLHIILIQAIKITYKNNKYYHLSIQSSRVSNW